MYSSNYVSICLSVYFSNYLFIRKSLYKSYYLPVYLFTILFIFSCVPVLVLSNIPSVHLSLAIATFPSLLFVHKMKRLGVGGLLWHRFQERSVDSSLFYVLRILSFFTRLHTCPFTYLLLSVTYVCLFVCFFHVCLSVSLSVLFCLPGFYFLLPFHSVFICLASVVFNYLCVSLCCCMFLSVSLSVFSSCLSQNDLLLVFVYLSVFVYVYVCLCVCLYVCLCT